MQDYPQMAEASAICLGWGMGQDFVGDSGSEDLPIKHLRN